MSSQMKAEGPISLGTSCLALQHLGCSFNQTTLQNSHRSSQLCVMQRRSSPGRPCMEVPSPQL